MLQLITILWNETNMQFALLFQVPIIDGFLQCIVSLFRGTHACFWVALFHQLAELKHVLHITLGKQLQYDVAVSAAMNTQSFSLG